MAALQSIGFDLRSAAGRNWLTLLIAAPIQAGFVYTLLCGALSFHTDPVSLNGLLLMFYLIHLIPGALLAGALEWLHIIRGGGIALTIVFLGGVPISLLYARILCILFLPFFQRAESAGLRFLRMLPGLVVLGLAFCVATGVYWTLHPGKERVATRDILGIAQLVEFYLIAKKPLPEGDAAAQFQTLLTVNQHRHGKWLRMDPSRVAADGRYVDPWGSAYVFGWKDGGKPRQRAWAYSYGPNRVDEGGNGDDVATWK